MIKGFDLDTLSDYYFNSLVVPRNSSTEFIFTYVDDNINKADIFWRVMFGLALIPSVIQLILLLVGYIPESPIYLIEKNQRDEAKESLAAFYEINDVPTIFD